MEKAPAPPAAERTNVPNELPDHANRSNDLEAIVAFLWFIPLFRKGGFVPAWDSKTGEAVQIETKKPQKLLGVAFARFDLLAKQ